MANANNVSELDTTPGNNSALAGTSILGTGLLSTADDSFRNLASFGAKWWNDIGAINIVAGTGDAITITTLTIYTALKAGMLIRFVAGAANTTATTLNLDAIGAKAVRKISGGTDVALVAGDLAAGETYTIVYRSTANSAAGAWVLVGLGGSFVPISGGTMTGNLTVSKTSPQITLNDPASGTNEQYLFAVAGLNRWGLGKNATAESGGNVGSDFFIGRFTDAGSFVDFPFLITRSSGAVAVRSLNTSGATGGDKGADTFNASTYYKNGNYGVLFIGSPTATTSGTAIDYTSIPSGVRRITLTPVGVSTNGSSNMIVQIGAGSIVTTGYIGSTSNLAASAISTGTFTNGLNLQNLSGAGTTISGQIILTLENSATGAWVMNGLLGDSGGAGTYLGGSSKVLSGPLDRVRLTTANGTDTFDAGAINITYE